MGRTLTAREVGCLLGVSSKTVRDWANDGVLKGVKIDNGPYLVKGDFEISDGEDNKLDSEKQEMVALCRSGQSKNKPFCDGSHVGAGFESRVRATKEE